MFVFSRVCCHVFLGRVFVIKIHEIRVFGLKIFDALIIRVVRICVVRGLLLGQGCQNMQVYLMYWISSIFDLALKALHMIPKMVIQAEQSKLSCAEICSLL